MLSSISTVENTACLAMSRAREFSPSLILDKSCGYASLKEPSTRAAGPKRPIIPRLLASPKPTEEVPLKTRRGVLRYGWLNSDFKREPATFVLFPLEGPAIELRTQDGKPISPDHLVSYTNREVEVKGKKEGESVLLLEIRKVV